MRGIFFKTTLLLAVLFQSSLCLADQFDQPYFSALNGSWIGDGELMNSEGVATTIHEEWTAEREGDRFLIRGTRLSGEETQEFHWIFTFNASTELFECEYWHTGMETDLAFEVSLTENSAELRSPFGDAGGELFVSNSLEKNVIEGNVEFTSQNGEAFPIASIRHIKKEE